MVETYTCRSPASTASSAGMTTASESVTPSFTEGAAVEATEATVRGVEQLLLFALLIVSARRTLSSLSRPIGLPATLTLSSLIELSARPPLGETWLKKQAQVTNATTEDTCDVELLKVINTQY